MEMNIFAEGWVPRQKARCLKQPPSLLGDHALIAVDGVTALPLVGRVSAYQPAEGEGSFPSLHQLRTRGHTVQSPSEPWAPGSAPLHLKSPDTMLGAWVLETAS